MGLTIHQSFVKLGIETTNARLEMESTRPRLELTQKHAWVELHTEYPRIEIDQKEAFASAGLKGFRELAEEQSQIARSNAMEYIGRTAEDGNQLAAIENGGNPIADIALRNSYTEKEFVFAMIPKVGPKISVKPGSVQIDPGESLGANNGVKGEFTRGELNSRFIPGDVRIYLAQKNFINFEYKPDKIDLYL